MYIYTYIQLLTSLFFSGDNVTTSRLASFERKNERTNERRVQIYEEYSTEEVGEVFWWPEKEEEAMSTPRPNRYRPSS